MSASLSSAIGARKRWYRDSAPSRSKPATRQLPVVRPHRPHDDPGAVAQGDGGPGVVGAAHDS